ncbi:hypothetical protein [Facklamia sp. P12934]
MARYDYAKMNLIASVKLKQVQKNIEVTQKRLNKFINEYE